MFGRATIRLGIGPHSSIVACNNARVHKLWPKDNGPRSISLIRLVSINNHTIVSCPSLQMLNISLHYRVYWCEVE